MVIPDPHVVTPDPQVVNFDPHLYQRNYHMWFIWYIYGALEPLMVILIHKWRTGITCGLFGTRLSSALGDRFFQVPGLRGADFLSKLF